MGTQRWHGDSWCMCVRLYALLKSPQCKVSACFKNTSLLHHSFKVTLQIEIRKLERTTLVGFKSGFLFFVSYPRFFLLSIPSSPRVSLFLLVNSEFKALLPLSLFTKAVFVVFAMRYWQRRYS